MCTLVSCDQRGRATAQHRHSRCGDQPQRAEARAFRVLCFVCMSLCGDVRGAPPRPPPPPRAARPACFGYRIATSVRVKYESTSSSMKTIPVGNRPCTHTRDAARRRAARRRGRCQIRDRRSAGRGDATGRHASRHRAARCVGSDLRASSDACAPCATAEHRTRTGAWARAGRCSQLSRARVL